MIPKLFTLLGKAKPWFDGLTMPYGKEYRKMLADSGWIPRHLGYSLDNRLAGISTSRAAIRRRYSK